MESMERKETDAIAGIERAMVAIRRRQRRRAILWRSTPDAPKPFGAHFDVLDTIEQAEENGETVGVKEVAAALDVDQPRASKLVAAAVADGYVAREADQVDGRRTLLVRTELGRDVLARAHRARRAAMEHATEGWSAEERAVFAELLGRFVRGLDG